MKHSAELAGHRLADLEQACANLRLLGAGDDTEIRVRTSATFSADGGSPKTLTGRWKNQPDIISAPSARPLHGGPIPGRGVADGPVDR